MRDKMCNECKRCDGDLCTYFDNYSDRESTLACILFEPKKPTVFDYLMQSEEKLAEKLVYENAVKGRVPIYGEYGSTIGEQYVITNVWSSALTDDAYTNRAEALVATIEELKKEVKDENSN